jgi:hypothetical protein
MAALRILRLRRFGNAGVVADVQARDAAFRTRSVAEQQEALDQAYGPFSSPLVPGLRRSGWDAHELVLGVPSIRDAWQRQHGPLAPDGTGGDEDQRLAVAEIERLRPDVVLDSNLNVLDHRTLRLLRSRVAETRLYAGYMGTEKRFHRALGLDLVLVPCGSMASALRPLHRGRIAVLPHSFDPGIVAGLPSRTIEHPLVFAGALGPRYTERHRILMALLAETELEAWIGLRKGVTRTPDGWLTVDDEPRVGRSWKAQLIDALPTSLLAAAASRGVERLGDHLNLRLARATGGFIASPEPMRDPAAVHPDRCHPPVHGASYLSLIRRSGTVMHRGIDALGGCGGALRLFEVTGVGAALLVEDSPMVRELFEADREVITYRDPRDAVERARWLTQNPDERERIAEAGQRRTLRDHTAESRARQLDPLLRQALEERHGSARRRRP